MSKTLLDDNDHWIALEGEGSDCKLPLAECVGFCPQHNPEPGNLPMLRIAKKVEMLPQNIFRYEDSVAVPIDKLRNALRRAHGPRRSWDDFFLDMAALWASRSKDPSTKVGCIIVDSFRRTVSTGYNGYPRGTRDEGLSDREAKYLKTIHAETNALLLAPGPIPPGSTLYVWPCPPCVRCAAAIIQTQCIRRVISPPASADMLSRWEKELTLAATLLGEAGVVQEWIGEAVEP